MTSLFRMNWGPNWAERQAAAIFQFVSSMDTLLGLVDSERVDEVEMGTRVKMSINKREPVRARAALGRPCMLLSLA